MGFKSTLKFDSKIFDKSARARAFGQVAMKTARDFKEQTRRKMVESKPTGKRHERSRGHGFTTSHVASRSGQRPAVDSGNLANRSLKAERTGELSAVTYVDDSIAPYGKRLQEEMNRPIMDKSDARTAEIQLQYNAEKALQKLL